jgi:hypothetical protein
MGKAAVMAKPLREITHPLPFPFPKVKGHDNITEPTGFIVPTGRMVPTLFKKKKKYKTKNPTKIITSPVLTEQKAKTLIAVLETKLAQLKEDQTTIALPSDLIESTVFPNVDADYKTRVEQCRFLRSYLENIRRDDLKQKIESCKRAVKRISK